MVVRKSQKLSVLVLGNISLVVVTCTCMNSVLAGSLHIMVLAEALYVPWRDRMAHYFYKI